MTADKKPRKAKLIPADVVHAEWRKQPGFQAAYDALEDEFAIMSALIKARAASSLSQNDIAKRMKTTQSSVARIESGAHRVSLKTLRNYADATGHRVSISLVPRDQPGRKGKGRGLR